MGDNYNRLFSGSELEKELSTKKNDLISTLIIFMFFMIIIGGIFFSY